MPACKTDAAVADRTKEQQYMAAEMRAKENLSAAAWKERGNALLKAGQLDEAEGCYSRSLKVEATCIAYANR